MSPKSRGRRPGRGRPKRQHRPDRPVRQLRLSDHLMADAAAIADEPSALEVEMWASDWLGRAWVDAGIDERRPEHLLCMEVVGRASSRPTAVGLAAVAALQRVAPSSELSLLGGTVDLLSQDLKPPPWLDAPSAGPVGAWRAVDVWGSERVLFVEFDGASRPHTLLASVNTVGGVMIEKLALLEPDAATAWERLREPDDVPMVPVPTPVDEVLAELADALRVTDMTWPRQDDEEFVELRALAWSRCRAHLPAVVNLEDWEAEQKRRNADRPALVADFLDQPTVRTLDRDVAGSLAELFLDFGEAYLPSGWPSWSPAHVELFMTNWLPRKAVLDDAERRMLPAALRAWLRFALHRRGVEDRWITPVVATVELCLPEFTEAFDDEASWGPAKHLAAELADRGVDMSDREAVEWAVRAVNAENLARTLMEPPDPPR